MPSVYKYKLPGNSLNGRGRNNDRIALRFILCSLLIPFFTMAQDSSSSQNKLVFVSDTQQPMWVEKIVLKPDHNIEATSHIYKNIYNEKAQNIYMLGDIVALGYENKKWKAADKFIGDCRKEGASVNAVLGNHEVLGRDKKGEMNFSKRFPASVKTGYVSVSDSIAVVLLNSNFNTLTKAEKDKQQDWYEKTMKNLDATDSIATIIVACHHSPYSNSRIVGSSEPVQLYFVPAYLQSKKAQLFISGHAHAFEHFKKYGKDFVVIGGGGGLHQPLNESISKIPDEAAEYKPHYHYLTVTRNGRQLDIVSHYLNPDFSAFAKGHSFYTSPNLVETATVTAPLIPISLPSKK